MLLAAAFLLSVIAPTEPTQPQQAPIKWAIAKAPAAASAGDTIVVQLTAQIADGWHLYALVQPSDGPIPTTIAVGPRQVFALDPKSIEAPEAKEIDDENFGMRTRHYDASVVFRLPVKIAATAAGRYDLEVSARYQACSKTICLKPVTIVRKTGIRIISAGRK